MKKSLIYYIITTSLIIFILISLNSLIALTHPISLGIILVSYSLILGVVISIICFSWLAYLLVLVFLGGVIVLIIYMCTLSANEKFFLLKKINILIFIGLFFITFFMVFSRENSLVFLTQAGTTLGITYEGRNLLNMVGLIIYLLITLVAVVKLVKFEAGPIIKRL